MWGQEKPPGVVNSPAENSLPFPPPLCSSVFRVFSLLSLPPPALISPRLPPPPSPLSLSITLPAA